MNAEIPKPISTERELKDGDEWVTAADGNKYWGKYGAAGILVHDPAKGIVLQHRVEWSHFGGTWGVLGGAISANETAIAGAIREATEEAGIPDGAIRPRYTYRADKGGWAYTTVICEAVTPFEPVITDLESLELKWIPLENVRDYPLHPEFERTFGAYEHLFGAPTAIVVDTANVVGAVPNAWWRDRAGAAAGLRDKLAGLAEVSAEFAMLDNPDGNIHTVLPDWIMVVEGDARGVSSADGVRVVASDGHGDDTIVQTVADELAAGKRVVCITSDRELQARVQEIGAHAQGVSRLLELHLQ